ncbi:hypothetical protein QYF36_019541 [Acer negundo]|nr:hypothetical protein QYF36_019541 [Acer negundo]
MGKQENMSLHFDTSRAPKRKKHPATKPHQHREKQQEKTPPCSTANTANKPEAPKETGSKTNPRKALQTPQTNQKHPKKPAAKQTPGKKEEEEEEEEEVEEEEEEECALVETYPIECLSVIWKESSRTSLLQPKPSLLIKYI